MPDKAAHTPTSRFRAAVNAFTRPATASNGKRNAVAEMRTALSTLVQRMKFGNTLSRFSFGTIRDTYTALGYPARLSPEVYRDSYERDDIAARIVDAFPRATWSGGVSVVDNPDPKISTPFKDEAEALYKRLSLASSLMRADILSGLGEWSILWMVSDGQPNTPLQSNKIHYLSPVGQDKASIKSSIKDVTDSRFGLPEFYTVQTDAGSFDVHWSRALHIASGRLDSRVKGMPELQSVWNRLEDLRKVVGGGSEAAWRRMDPGTIFDLDKDAEIDAEEEADFENQVDEFYHGMRRYILGRNLKPTPLTAPVHNFGPNVKAIASIIAGAKGIPMQMLLGSELGMASAKKDGENFDQRAAERQLMFGEPLVRELTDGFIAQGTLPEPVDGYTVVWPSTDSVDETDKSLIIERLTRANKAQTEADGTIVISSAEIRQDILDKSPMDSDRVAMRAAADNDPLSDVDLSATHAAADRHRDAFAAAVETVWADAGTITDLSDVDTMLTAVDVAFADLLPTAIFDTLSDGGQSAMEVSRTRQSFFRSATRRSAQFEFDFDTTNQRALDWAADRSSQLITEIGPETRAAVQTIIADGISAGRPPTQIARDINRIVGLRSDQVDALLSFGSRLSSAEGGSTVFMGDTPVAVPAAGPSTDFVDKQVERYATRLRKQRAVLIARTETLRASNEGQRQLWLQAQDRGDLPTDLKRTWIHNTKRHADRAGTVVGVNESWPWGTEPGEEPNCGCAQGLVG
jgi:hypothetical protein